MARKMTKRPVVQVIGSGQATDTIALHSREDLTWLSATAKAAERAYKMAGLGPEDLDLVEVHDCFTIAEICVIEALGLVKKGQGGPASENGLTALGGKIPVNTSGGLKSKGHPVGATGVAQVIEVVEQLRGEAGGRQVKGAQVALTQNMGGTGGSTAVHIFKRV
jgi:acetyl-CoA C-acetyltransferase